MDDGVRTDADGGRFLCLRLTVYEDVHTALFKYLANKRPKRRSRLLLAYLSGSAGSERVFSAGSDEGIPSSPTLAGVATRGDLPGDTDQPELRRLAMPGVFDGAIDGMDDL